MWNFQEVMWNFKGSWLLALNEISEGCNIYNFTKFPGVELWIMWNFQGYREKPKNINIFKVFQKCMSSTPTPPPVCLFFFWNSPFLPKQLTWIGPMQHLPQKKHWPYIKIGYFHHFHVFIIIISFRKVHTAAFVIPAHWGEEYPRMGSKLDVPSVLLC